MHYFLDSSALVKRYVMESGSDWVLQITDPSSDNQIHVAAVAWVEVVSALARQHRAGKILLSDQVDALNSCRFDFIHQYRLVDLTDPVIQRAVMMAEVHFLRGYDAVQLATALELNERRTLRDLPSLFFVSADVELNAAASTEGLLVDDPNAHP